MPNFSDVMKKLGELAAHIAEVAAEHPQATAAIAEMVQAALAAKTGDAK